MVAIASDSQSAPDDRVVVDSSNGGKREHHVGDDRTDAPADRLGDDVQTGVAGADRSEPSGDQRDRRVEVCTRHRPEHEDQSDERACRGGRVLEQLQADVGRRQVAGHDARADHGHDQQPRPDRFGHQTPGEIEAELPGAGLDGDPEFLVVRTQRVAHRFPCSRWRRDSVLMRRSAIECASAAPRRCGRTPSVSPRRPGRGSTSGASRPQRRVPRGHGRTPSP